MDTDVEFIRVAPCEYAWGRIQPFCISDLNAPTADWPCECGWEMPSSTARARLWYRGVRLLPAPALPCSAPGSRGRRRRPSIELDDNRGREAIYLLVSEEPLTLDAIKVAFVESDSPGGFPVPEDIDLPAQVVREIVVKE